MTRWGNNLWVLGILRSDFNVGIEMYRVRVVYTRPDVDPESRKPHRTKSPQIPLFAWSSNNLQRP